MAEKSFIGKKSNLKGKNQVFSFLVKSSFPQNAQKKSLDDQKCPQKKTEISRRRLTLAAMTSGEETPSSSPRRGPLSSILSWDFRLASTRSQGCGNTSRSPDRTFRQLANQKMVPVRIFFNNSLDRKGFVAVLVQKPAKKRSLVASGRSFGLNHTLNRLILLVTWLCFCFA